MLGVILATALVAPSDLGFLFRHHEPASAAECRDDCGAQTAKVAALIRRLQTSPRWRDRDNAAHALRRVHWKCHPEAPLALVDALLNDCEEEVREEAAESLSKMKPCLPEVHAALDQAANCDPDRATRKWASRGLANLGRECIDACSICGTDSPHEVIVPEQRIITEPPLVLPPGNAVPLPSPPAEVLPPSEMPPVPGTSSPPFRGVQTTRPLPTLPGPAPARVRAG